MQRIDRPELREILLTFGIQGVLHTHSIQVDSNVVIYPFRDEKNRYILITSDYLGNYDRIQMPHHFAFKFNDINYRYHVVQNYPRLDIDTDNPSINKFVYKASNGLDCVLYRLAI